MLYNNILRITNTNYDSKHCSKLHKFNSVTVTVVCIHLFYWYFSFDAVKSIVFTNFFISYEKRFLKTGTFILEQSIVNLFDLGLMIG